MEKLKEELKRCCNETSSCNICPISCLCRLFPIGGKLSFEEVLVRAKEEMNKIDKMLEEKDRIKIGSKVRIKPIPNDLPYGEIDIYLGGISIDNYLPLVGCVFKVKSMHNNDYVYLINSRFYFKKHLLELVKERKEND